MENGWIKLHRKFLSWEWWDDTEAVKVFLYLLLSANHEPGRWRGIDIGRGQLITGLHSLSHNCGLSVKVIRNRLDKLEKTGEIVRQAGNQYSIITVCKYDEYQFNNEEKGKQTGKRRAGKGQAKGNKQEEKEEKEIIYNSFYDSEIEKSEKNPDYIKFVQVLFGNNSTGQPLESVLRMPQQMTFEQFLQLMYFKTKYKLKVSPILEAMENNKKLKDRKSVWLSFQTYMKNAHPETANK